MRPPHKSLQRIFLTDDLLTIPIGCEIQPDKGIFILRVLNGFVYRNSEISCYIPDEDIDEVKQIATSIMSGLLTNGFMEKMSMAEIAQNSVSAANELLNALNNGL